uniref:RNA-directed RNA polymerase n=1 Tax=Angiostrongylus cantonensis TaxID=6313 RepID=A0A0K0DGM2_ANGCA
LFKGNKTAVPTPTVQLNGLSILPKHVIVENTKNKKITITACQDAEILVNGKKITRKTELLQNDRWFCFSDLFFMIFFGGNRMYVFNDPEKRCARKDITITITYVTYVAAQKEIAQRAGIAFSNERNKSKADLILEEELISTMPLVYRANAMAVELNRNVKFELVLVSPEMRDLRDGLTEIWVNVHNLAEDTRFMWEKARFMNRYYGMQEMSTVKDGWYKKRKIQYSIPLGNISTYFAINIILTRFIARYCNLLQSSCKYHFFNDKDATSTSLQAGSSPSFSHEHVFTFKSVSQEVMDYLLHSDLCITLWGTQKARPLKQKAPSTKQ